jgi:Domain of unknown function (DUF4157)
MYKHDFETGSGSTTHLARQSVVSEEDKKKLGQGASVQRSTRPGGSLLQLQRQYGNRYVQRVVARAASSDGDVTPDVERSIESSRGGGHSLDRGVSADMGKVFNADFSGVRVHTDAGADGLNRSLSARAFTTGQDIYFRQGEYNPGSSGGRELLAHELTHVVQQNAEKVQSKDAGTPAISRCTCGSGESADRAVQTKLSVSTPGDIYEQEADRMARAYVDWDRGSTRGPDVGNNVQRQMPEEEKDKSPM